MNTIIKIIDKTSVLNNGAGYEVVGDIVTNITNKEIGDYDLVRYDCNMKTISSFLDSDNSAYLLDVISRVVNTLDRGFFIVIKDEDISESKDIIVLLTLRYIYINREFDEVKGLVFSDLSNFIKYYYSEHINKEGYGN